MVRDELKKELGIELPVVTIVGNAIRFGPPARLEAGCSGSDSADCCVEEIDALART